MVIRRTKLGDTVTTTFTIGEGGATTENVTLETTGSFEVLNLRKDRPGHDLYTPAIRSDKRPRSL